MGGNFSTLPQPSENFPYFTLTFRQQDKIKLTLATENVISAVKQAVIIYWAPGIQCDGYDKGGAYEIKFNGFPFSKSGSHDAAIQSKKVCCKILTDLYAMGWQLVTSSDLSRTQDLTTWFFKKENVVNKPPSILCVSMSSHDSLQLINAPLHLRPKFIEAVSIGYAGGGGIQEEWCFIEDYEVKLRGYPWNTSDCREGVFARKLLLSIFRVFDRERYRFYGAANLKGTADCMFFMNDTNYPAGQSKFAMVSLNQNDRIRLVNCSKEVIDIVRETIKKFWILQDETNLTVAWEFKLKGYPWWANGGESVAARFLIAKLFQALLVQGWGVLTALDISRRLNDKSVFILKSCPPENLSHCCISLNETDKLRLVNAPESMTPLVRKVLEDYWPYGVQREAEYFGSYEFKLGASPWASYGGNEYLSARCMMCILLKKLMDSGWRQVCSADVSAKYHSSDNGPDYPLDVHSWFLVKEGGPRRLGSFAGSRSGDSLSTLRGFGPSGSSFFTVSPNLGRLRIPEPAPNEPPPSYAELYETISNIE